MSTVLWFQAWLINIVCIRLEFGQSQLWGADSNSAAMRQLPAAQPLRQSMAAFVIDVGRHPPHSGPRLTAKADSQERLNSPDCVFSRRSGGMTGWD